MTSSPALTAQEAFDIDRKIDDGFPQTGNVTAIYLNSVLVFTQPAWAAGGGVQGTADTSATSGSASTCYDNQGAGGAAQQYSTEINNGSNVNCALSFRFQ
jgi:hypothetical protein